MSTLYVTLLHRNIIDMNNFDKVNPHKIKTLKHHCDTQERERERNLNPLKR